MRGPAPSQGTPRSENLLGQGARFALETAQFFRRLRMNGHKTIDNGVFSGLPCPGPGAPAAVAQKSTRWAVSLEQLRAGSLEGVLKGLGPRLRGWRSQGPRSLPNRGHPCVTRGPLGWSPDLTELGSARRWAVSRRACKRGRFPSQGVGSGGALAGAGTST